MIGHLSSSAQSLQLSLIICEQVLKQGFAGRQCGSSLNNGASRWSSVTKPHDILRAMVVPRYCEKIKSNYPAAEDHASYPAIVITFWYCTHCTRLISEVLLAVFATVRGPRRAWRGDCQEPWTGRDGKMCWNFLVFPSIFHSTTVYSCNLLLSIARFPEGDPAILRGQGGEASMEISTRDIVKMWD